MRERPCFEAVALGEKVDTEKVTPGVVRLAKHLLDGNPKISAFLFECTQMPQYCDAVRFATGKPVYDAITNANMVIDGFQDNPPFGLQDWRVTFDNMPSEFNFSMYLSAEEKEQDKLLPEQTLVPATSVLALAVLVSPKRFWAYRGHTAGTTF